MDIEKQPTEEQRREFEEAEAIGEVNAEEYAGVRKKLSSSEKIIMIAGTDPEAREEPKKLFVLTQRRLLIFSAGGSKLLGNNNKEFEDIKIDTIEDMSIEERKGFDILRIETGDEERKYMSPEEAAVKIAGGIRDIQNSLKPAEKLEKLSEQKEEGNITEEEFQEKKKKLMERI